MVFVMARSPQYPDRSRRICIQCTLSAGFMSGVSAFTHCYLGISDVIQVLFWSVSPALFGTVLRDKYFDISGAVRLNEYFSVFCWFLQL